ncbi:MAG: hypothetical protein GC162_19830 [Planctomycetes bacterium]|nr:hypothetical protein [Planctomycetota bacterium]
MHRRFAPSLRRAAAFALLASLPACNTTLSNPGATRRLSALLDWQADANMSRDFYTQRYYYQSNPLDETADALHQVHAAATASADAAP